MSWKREAIGRDVSIPQSGFLVVKLGGICDSWTQVHSFNPSVGILGGQTYVSYAVTPLPERFQSLSRDSWWSNLILGQHLSQIFSGFNPSVGILGGQTSVDSASLNLSNKFQSLSRDSWWSNPEAILRRVPGGGFQSLSRDSWWSNQGAFAIRVVSFKVSIPQSGFLVVKPR